MTNPIPVQGLSEALQACPHCGSSLFARVKPYPWEKEGEADLVWGYHVLCDASGFDNRPRGCGAASGWAETPAEAAEAWNTRALTELQHRREAEAVAWRVIDEKTPRDGTRILLAKIVGHPDHETALWWATIGHWSSKWSNWNDGIEPAGLVPPTHWLPVSAHGIGSASPALPSANGVRVKELEKALLEMQQAAGLALEALPADQQDGTVGTFLASIHRHCASALSLGHGGDFEPLSALVEQP